MSSIRCSKNILSDVGVCIDLKTDGGSDNSTVYLAFHLIAESNEPINVTVRVNSFFFFAEMYIGLNADYVHQSFIYINNIK